MFSKYDKFATFSLIIGIIALPSSSFIITGIIFGIIAITLGIISRINYEKFNLYNVLGITFGGIAILLSGFMLLGTIMLMRDPAFMNEFSKIMNMYYN